ncbi:hypothetical protein BO71DRAFT_425897 [Aspergillus ellipticus CBS 707.79]|uniref:Uncharacterized protein n=1 Tax=Aspergillus ellipticus CBS 707.79 TaxID=1448320 RepID=A0A319ECV7_9EURO|nr:hypothetical protein BO71DRAFT_425897 [Aspergillus ellipticus CBS 707.79]
MDTPRVKAEGIPILTQQPRNGIVVLTLGRVRPACDDPGDRSNSKGARRAWKLMKLGLTGLRLHLQHRICISCRTGERGVTINGQDGSKPSVLPHSNLRTRRANNPELPL